MPPEEFKFPDEIEKKAEKVDSLPDDFKVDIVDDTPPDDRNRDPLPKEIVDEVEKDDLEEYSEKVQKRLKQMRKGWHDERRAKEAAAREREEALAFAQSQLQENRQLKQRLGSGEKIFVNEMSRSAKTELETAKSSLTRAYESGDASKITEAQEMLTDAKLRLRELERFQPSLQEEDQGVQRDTQTQVPSHAAPDPKAVTWKQNNGWFGTDTEMTALALGLHEKLVRSGVDPRSDDYYRQVDQTMKKRFPEYFSEETQPTKEEPPPRKQTTVVAPAARSTAPRQIRITASEAAIAKRLGLTPEAYAREKLKLENSNG
jgi:hypothetical protein